MQHSKPQYNLLLSFDLEEFDIPHEYGALLPLEEQLAVTRQGLERLLPVLEQLQIKATFFTTAFFAQQNQPLVRKVAATHEIASHAFYHSNFTEKDIAASREILENISGQQVVGFRMPRLAPIDKQLIKKAGYLYDASLNPTLLPGRYDNRKEPRTLFVQNDLHILPSSVTPNLRLPLFWLSFKNTPLFLFKQWTRLVLTDTHVVCLYFHPWEFADLSAYSSLPFYTRKPCGSQLLDKFTRYLLWLQQKGEFSTIRSYITDNRQST